MGLLVARSKSSMDSEHSRCWKPSGTLRWKASLLSKHILLLSPFPASETVQAIAKSENAPNVDISPFFGSKIFEDGVGR
jgi:hypothetical protein